MSLYYPDTETKQQHTRKLQTNIPYEYRQKNPQQNISKPNIATYKKDCI